MHGVFVDDQDEEYAETLSTPKVLKLDFVRIGEVATLANSIIANESLIAAIDYRLDEVKGDLRADQTYKGSALAQHLRDAAIENPGSDLAIVLVSGEAKIHDLYKPDVTAHDLFDKVYVKEQVNANRSRIRDECVSLCNAYSRLRASQRPYDLAELMDANEADRPQLDSQELRAKMATASAPHVVVRILLNKIIDRPGILMDEHDVCAHLGMAKGTLNTLSGPLNDAGLFYTGLFSDAWPRWWSHRVEAWATSLFGRRATGLPAEERARILSERFDVKVSPASSPWNEETTELIAVACAACRRGTEVRHAVSVFEPTLPRYLNRRRVCWDCIRTEKYNHVQPTLTIDESDQDIVEHVISQFTARD